MFKKKRYKKIILMALGLSMVFTSMAWAEGEIYSKKIDYVSKNLEEKNKEIRKLKRRINFLKGIEDESTKKTLEKIEKNLNQKYGKYKNIDLDISLEEDLEGIFIELNLDLSSTEKRNSWIKIKYKDKDSLIKDAVTQVRLEFPEYNIRGKIYDLSTKRNLYDFEEKTEKKIHIENKDYLDEGYFYDEYYDYSDNSEKVEKIVKRQFITRGILDASLKNLEYISKTASFKVEFSNKYKDEWEKLGKYERQEILEEIVKEIKIDNDHIEEIYGDIYMGLRRVESYKK